MGVSSNHLRRESLVVVMQPGKHGPRHDRSVGLRRISPVHALTVSDETAVACGGFGTSRGTTRTVRYGLTDTLVGSPGVVVGDVLGKNPFQLSLTKDHKPIQRVGVQNCI